MPNLKEAFKSWWKKLLSQNASPHSIALGLALGMFVGFLPIMGIQMPVVLLVSLPFKKANKFAALSGVWVTNYVTVIPIYAFIYWVGTFFMPGVDVLSYSEFKHLILQIFAQDGLEAKWQALLNLGWDIVVPMFVGGAVVGIVAAIVTYFVTYRLVERARNLKDNGEDHAPAE